MPLGSSGALSSAGPERLPYKQEVAGSNPAAPIGVTGFRGSGRDPRERGIPTFRDAAERVIAFHSRGW